MQTAALLRKHMVRGQQDCYFYQLINQRQGRHTRTLRTVIIP